MNNKLENNKLDSAHERLRFLRSITRLDRTSLAAKYNIPEITLRLWENDKVPITNKGINRCLEVYRQEGINVTEQWLKDGIGDLPTINHTLISFMDKSSPTAELIKNNIENDYAYFKNTYPDCILFKVSGEEMMPSYKSGDFVIGRKNNEDLIKLNNKDAIILLESGEVVFRRVFITLENKINLSCTNPLIEGEIIFDAKIRTIAPVIIHYVL